MRTTDEAQRIRDWQTRKTYLTRRKGADHPDAIRADRELGITLLTGAPKVAKSWLMLGLLLTLAFRTQGGLPSRAGDSDRRMR